MPSFATQRRVRFTPRQMFDVVADVEQYPKFLPMCDSLVIRSRQNTPDGHSILTATMGVGYKAIRETFTTRVTLAPQEPRILVEYLDGPFKRLENRWRFLPDGQDAGRQIRALNAPGLDYRFLHRLRIPIAHAGHPDGRAVR